MSLLNFVSAILGEGSCLGSGIEGSNVGSDLNCGEAVCSMTGRMTRQERFKERQQDLTPQEELKAQIQSLFRQGRYRHRVSGEDLTIFTRQVSTMLSSGIPLHQALLYYGETSEGDLPEVVRGLAADVASGHTFSNAMKAYPRIFNSIYVALAQMGEQSGQITIAYRRMADLLERQTHMRKRVVAALTYPFVLFIVSSLAIVGFIYFVLPMMTPMFESSGVVLPLPTRILMSMQTVVPLATFLLIFLLIAAWFGKPWIRRFLKRRPDLVRQMHSIPFYIPVVSGIYTKLSTARVLYSISTMLDAGLTLTSTIKRSAAAAGNEFVAYRMNQANRAIMDGSSFGEALDIYQVFPRGAVQMLSVGEESANLTDMVQHVADMYDSEVELALNDIASILEPMIMIVMGCVVGFIVLAAILPTVQLIQNL